MPARHDAAIDFLLTRRSRPAKTLMTPVPGRDALRPILTAGARVPDHGKLEPWRFIVLERAALRRIGALIPAAGDRLGRDDDAVAKQRTQFDDADLAVAVICSPKPSEKVPEVEQVLSAGAACLSLLNAALAAGWGANWLTGWASHDAEFRLTALGLAPHESVAGFIHIGTERAAPPERPRPDLDAIVSWVAE